MQLYKTSKTAPFANRLLLRTCFRDMQRFHCKQKWCPFGTDCLRRLPHYLDQIRKKGTFIPSLIPVFVLTHTA